MRRAPAPPGRRLSALVAAIVTGLLAGGCGAAPPDLFAVQRSGSIAGARLEMVVNDGGFVRCNRGQQRMISDPQLLEARFVQTNLHDPASKGLVLAPGPQPVFRYDVRTQDGHVSFSDDSAGQPSVLFRLALLVRQVAQQVCHLPR